MKQFFVLFVFLAPYVGNAQSTASRQGFKYANGVEYKIVKDVPGKNAGEGDILSMNIVWKIGKNDGKSKDSVIIDTRKMNHGKPTVMPLISAKFVGDMSAGLTYLSAGDSAVIRVSVDSLKKNLKDQPLPPFAKPGNYFIYEISMVSVKSKAEVERENEKSKGNQSAEDDRQLKEYFARNHIAAKKLPSGVYYTIQTQGSGPNVTKGQTVSIMYTGKTLDGKTFDSNAGKDALKFEVGAGNVIPGMDGSMEVMKKGTIGTLYIPSGLAYGNRAQGPIAANSILIFEMKISDVK